MHNGVALCGHLTLHLRHHLSTFFTILLAKMTENHPKIILSYILFFYLMSSTIKKQKKFFDFFTIGTMYFENLKSRLRHKKSYETYFFIIALLSPVVKLSKNSVCGCRSNKKKFCRGSPLKVLLSYLTKNVSLCRSIMQAISIAIHKL